MKITKSQLREIIREEIQSLNEMPKGIPKVPKGDVIYSNQQINSITDALKRDIETAVSALVAKFSGLKGKSVLVYKGQAPHTSPYHAWKVKVNGIRAGKDYDGNPTALLIVSSLDNETKRNMKNWYGSDYGSIPINDSITIYELPT